MSLVVRRAPTNTSCTWSETEVILHGLSGSMQDRLIALIKIFPNDAAFDVIKRLFTDCTKVQYVHRFHKVFSWSMLTTNI